MKTILKGERGRRLGPIIILGVAQALLSELGIRFQYYESEASLVWPAAGVAVAGLFRWGVRCWPGVWLGAFFFNLLRNPPALAIALAAAHTLGPLAGAWLLTRRKGFDAQLNRRQDLLAFIIGPVMGGPALSAAGGVLSLCAFGTLDWGGFIEAFWKWGLGDAMGVLVIAPSILTWRRNGWAGFQDKQSAKAAAGSLAGVSLIALYVFGSLLPLPLHMGALAILPFPILIWAAMRLDNFGSACSVLCLTCFAVWGTANGYGPFANQDLHAGLVHLWSYLSVAAVICLLIRSMLSERRQIQESLEQAQSQARLGSWEMDIGDQKGWWSREMFRLFEFDPSLGTPSFEQFLSRVHPQDRHRLLEVHGTLTEPGRRIELEFRGDPSRWPTRWFVGKVECAAVNDRLMLLGVTQEITEAKQAEAALRSSEETLRQSQKVLQLVLDNIPQAVFWKDRDSRYLGCNKICAQSSGFETPDRMIGRSDADFPSLTSEQSEAFTRTDREIFETGKPKLGIVERATFADGSTRWLETNKLPMHDSRGRVIGLLGTWQDITARKAAEEHQRESDERLRLAVDGARLGTWEFDLSNQRITWGGMHFELFGVNPETFKGGVDEVLQLIHPDDREAVKSATRRSVFEGAPFRSEFRVVRPDSGEVRWMSSKGRVERVSRGGSLRLCGVVQDITDYRSLEVQLLQAQKMEALGTLAGGIAHDFNNLLTAILGNAELAKLEAHNPVAVQSSIDEIAKSGMRARNLVRQILTFSRQQPQNRSIISLAPVLEESIGLLRATLPAGVELKMATSRTAPKVLADATQINQVILNLCTNAWHALPDERGEIVVTLEGVKIDAESARRLAGLRRGEYARLSVRDNGCGMDEAMKSKIFEPFYTSKAPGKGTGLGLSVVHGIVKTHEGIIDVRSRLEEGSMFHLYFPAASNESLASMQSESKSSAARGRGERVLFIDDEPSLTRLATKMIERLGYRIEVFTRAEQAIQAFAAAPNRYDAVITDLNMPGVSGLDAAREILDIRPGMGVILNSGYISDELQRRSREIGIARILTKPNTLDELGDALSGLLARADNKE